MDKYSGPRYEKMNIFLKELDDSDWKVRAKAVYNLKEYKNSKVLDALIEKLNDKNVNVWISAANVLIDRKNPRIIIRCPQKNPSLFESRG